MLQYPTLSHIAKDYLAIQGSAVPSEHAFSSSGITDVARRNRLASKTFAALQILKAAYRNKHISATTKAELAMLAEWVSRSIDSYYL